MSKIKSCVSCGQKLDANARFCTMCGKLQEDPMMEEAEQQVESDMQEANTNMSAEELGSKAKAAFADFSQKVKDTNFPDVAKNTAKSAINSMEQAAKQSRAPRVEKGKRGKKKAQLFETETFDSKEAARELYDRNTKKLARCRIGLIVAAVVSIIGAILLIHLFDPEKLPVLLYNHEETFTGFVCIGSIISYLLAGGILVALRYSFRIAKFGWFLIPYFPMDLAIGCIALMFSILAFIYVPIISVGINYIQTKKSIEQAEVYFGIFDE